MMKKYFFLFLFCIGSLCLLSFSVIPHIYERNQTNEETEIELKGEFKKGSFRSTIIPIIAEKHGSIVFVQFQANVGILQVTVTGEEDIVYTTVVDTTMPSTLSIPLDNYSPGSYTITFSNELGMMWGDFTL